MYIAPTENEPLRLLRASDDQQHIPADATADGITAAHCGHVGVTGYHIGDQYDLDDPVWCHTCVAHQQARRTLIAGLKDIYNVTDTVTRLAELDVHYPDGTNPSTSRDRLYDPDADGVDVLVGNLFGTT